MIKINVVEIKKQLTGEKDFRFDVGPDELGLSEQDLPVDGQVHIEGKITNAGDVLLVNVSEKAVVRRTCARCLKEFTAESTAKALEKFYPEIPSGKPSDIRSAVSSESLLYASMFSILLPSEIFCLF